MPHEAPITREGVSSRVIFNKKEIMPRYKIEISAEVDEVYNDTPRKNWETVYRQTVDALDIPAITAIVNNTQPKTIAQEVGRAFPPEFKIL